MPHSDQSQTAKELEARYKEMGSQEHPDFSRLEWTDAVTEGLTTEFYWQWVEKRIAAGQRSPALVDS